MNSTVLTIALEDYLETIHELSLKHNYARVKNIAAARQVQPGSVSPALRRLAELGYIEYERREYVTLTELGQEAARRVLARHRLLTRFLHEFLLVEAESAEKDACLLEHHLSDASMDGLTRLFEFLSMCPDGKTSLMERFHESLKSGIRSCHCDGETCQHCSDCKRRERKLVSVAEMSLGQCGTVRSVRAHPAIRQRLLDMGIMPDVEIRVERIAPGGDTIIVKLLGFQLALRKEEASGIQVDLLD